MYFQTLYKMEFVKQYHKITNIEELYMSTYLPHISNIAHP